MKKLTAFALAAVLFAALLAGCNPSAQQAKAADTTETPAPTNNVPQNTEPAATETPAPLSGSLKIIGSDGVGPLMVDLAGLFQEKNADVTLDIVQAGSVAGIVSAQDGTADIGMSSRPLAADEAGLTQYTLCYDAIAIVVNQSSSVKALTSEQIARIFTGEITNWSEVGGGDGFIAPQSREMASGTRALLEELLLSDNAQFNDAACTVQSTDEDIAKAVENDGNAIGFLPMGLVKDYNVVAVSVDGAEATAQNAASGAYKLTSPFLLLTNGSESELTSAFLGWLKNDQAAKDCIAASHYILPE